MLAKIEIYAALNQNEWLVKTFGIFDSSWTILLIIHYYEEQIVKL